MVEWPLESMQYAAKKVMSKHAKVYIDFLESESDPGLEF